MPIYKGRRPGTHRIVIWLGNQRHEKVFEGGKREAGAEEARWRTELTELALAPPSQASPEKARPSFKDFCVTVYEPFAERHLPKTWKTSRVYFVATLIWFFGDDPIDTGITPARIEAYKAARLEGQGPEKARRGLKLAKPSIAPGTINNELRTLKTVLRHAADQGHEVTLPKFRRLPASGPGRPQAWTVEELGRLFDACHQIAPELVPVLTFLLNTGCRKGEAIACRWDWVDLKENLLRIPANDVWRPKNGLPREVPISDALRQTLMGPRRSNDWVFPIRGRHGSAEPTPYAGFPDEVWRRVRNEAGLKGGIHQLRHTYASHFLRNVPDLPLLAQVLGHSATKITELYTHFLPGHLGKARNAVNLDFSGKSPKSVATNRGGRGSRTKKA